MERRLVVVGCGLVGSAVIRSAIERSAEPGSFDQIVILSRSISDEFVGNPGIETIIGDAGSGALQEVLRNGDTLVLAAGSPDPRCEPRNVNRLLGPTAQALTETVQTAADLHDLHIILISSGGAVYGFEDDPVPESRPINPSSVYGAVKVAEEVMLWPLRGVNGNRVTVARCSTVYGRRRIGFEGQGLVQLAIDRLQAGQPLTLFGNGNDRRGYLLDSDLGDAVIGLTEAVMLEHDVYNLCSGQVHTGTEVVSEVASALDVQADVELLDSPNNHIVLDTSRLQAALPEFRFTTFSDGVERLIEAS